MVKVIDMNIEEAPKELIEYKRIAKLHFEQLGSLLGAIKDEQARKIILLHVREVIANLSLIQIWCEEYERKR